jgi:hypothetical protein
MRGVKLVARQALDYRGRRYGRGEVFEARADDALALRYRKQADFAPTKRQVMTAAIVAAESSAESPESSDSSGSPPSPDATDPPEHDGSRRRRPYRRRDLVPEP